MLYSQTLADRQINFFRSMLYHVLNGESEYADMVNPVIFDANALALGQKNYFTIDRDTYHVIVLLANSDTDFFKRLNTKHLNKSDYQHVDSILSHQRQLQPHFA